MTDDASIKTLEQETAEQEAMLNGDPGPMINYWADSETCPLGGWGPVEKGHKLVTDTMRWVGSRFTGADVVDLEHLVIASSGTWPTRPASSGCMSASTAGRDMT